MIANWKHITATGHLDVAGFRCFINPLNAKLNPICYLLALLGAHPILHVSRIRVNCTLLFIIKSLLCVFALYSIYATMSISIGLYRNLDLRKANKLHYITDRHNTGTV